MAWKFFAASGAEKRAPSSVVNPAVRAGSAVAQNIPNTGPQIIALEIEDYDTDTMHDTVTNNSRVTIQHAGTYSFNGRVSFNGNTTGSVRQLQLLKNGATVVAEGRTLPSTATTICFVEATLACNVGDYFELRCAQDSTANPLALVGANVAYQPYLEATKVDGAVVSYVGVPGSLVGQELAYAQITSNFNITDTAEGTGTAIITAPSITLDGTTVIEVEVFSPLVVLPVAAAGTGTLIFTLWDNGVELSRIAQFVNPGASAAEQVPLRTIFRVTPSAGAHVYKVSGYTSTTTGGPALVAGTGSGGAGSYVPSFIRVKRAA